MFLERTYYAIKPELPLGVRLLLRRWRAALRRRSHAAAWPIDPAAGDPPPGWPGWPAGKRFAVVLTHDVEGRTGLARVERLADLERSLGFHSSFNFVPEGDYRLPPPLRDALAHGGFEIGVHGLKHDGKLYNSLNRFERSAAGINRYLRDWDAVGFRSPFMQHRLPWLHRLNIEYDSSSFDTDPFEPEPDGYRTVFPFWVPGPAGAGYAELPYTLAQDFTLFTILREPGIRIWKEKLDWLAERGGMALLNTHPDFMCFAGRPARGEYPARFYEEFLRYVRDRYDGQFWSALPRDVARDYRARVPKHARNTRGRACMLVYSHYEADSRVRRYAEALAARGDQVDVISLAAGGQPLGSTALNGVAIHHIQHRDADERTKWSYASRHLRFLFASAAFLTRRHLRVRYDLVHVHNMPDFLVFAATVPKLTGARLILDIHDLLPELFAARFGARPNRLYVRLLKAAEKASAAFADHVIVANHLWHPKLVARSVAAARCSVYINHIDPRIFFPHPRTRQDGRIVAVFPGTFNWHQGLDLAVQAMALLHAQVPELEFHLYGKGRMEDDLRRLAARLNLNGSVRFHGSVPLDQIPQVMADADLGVVPKRADGFGDEAYSTKIMEFMSQGVPVIASRTKIDTYYFDDSVVRFFTPGDVQALADAILELVRRPDLRDALRARGYEYAARNNWDVRKRDYLALVDRLVAG